MSPGWGKGSGRKCPFAGPSWPGRHSKRCSCLGVSPISVSPSFSPPSQTWLEFLLQNGFCDYTREDTEAEPSFEIALPAIPAAGSNIIKSPIASPKKKQKKKKNEARIKKYSSTLLSQRQKVENWLKEWGRGSGEKFISNSCLFSTRRYD